MLIEHNKCSIITNILKGGCMFKLKEHGTDVKTEFLAGLTTFLTMMYIVPVNGFILADAGLPMGAVVTATALITILATLFSGLLL